MSLLRVAWPFLLAATLPLVASADRPPEEETPLRAHVITMGPGDDLFSRFGHIALMIENRDEKTARVYNFGTFDFTNPNLRYHYARGYLTYWLSVQGYAGMVRFARWSNRTMVVRELGLTPDQVDELALRLEINARPENREYAYRHYLDNCCTRIRDLLDDVTEGSISRGRRDAHTGRTHRYWTDRALRGLPLMSSIILFSLGPAIDVPITRWDEQFLPEVLVEDLDEIRIGDRGPEMVRRKRTVVQRQGSDEAVTPVLSLALIWGTLGTLFGALVLATALGRRRFTTRLAGIGITVWGALAGLGGLLLTLFWTITVHYDTHYNENLLVMPVTHLWLLGPGIKLIFTGRLGARTGRVISWYLVGALALITLDLLLKLGPFQQQNWGVIGLALAGDALALAALVRTDLAPLPRLKLRR